MCVRTVARSIHLFHVAPDDSPAVFAWDLVAGDLLVRKIDHVLDVMQKGHLVVIAAKQENAFRASARNLSSGEPAP